MAALATSTRYRPVAPLSLQSSSVLSQDVITTAKILVDSTSSAPVGVFTNPSSGGIAGNSQVEALAIVNPGAGNQICHIARPSNRRRLARQTALRRPVRRAGGRWRRLLGNIEVDGLRVVRRCWTALLHHAWRRRFNLDRACHGARRAHVQSTRRLHAR